jgi:hypothetical protein
MGFDEFRALDYPIPSWETELSPVKKTFPDSISCYNKELLLTSKEASVHVAARHLYNPFVNQAFDRFVLLLGHIPYPQLTMGPCATQVDVSIVYT